MEEKKPQMPSMKSPMVVIVVLTMMFTLLTFMCAGMSVIAHVIKHWGG
jgi:hypothetical protein